MAAGIKETKEAALGAIALGFYVAKLAKDGLQLSDVGAFLDKLKSDPVFDQKIKDAYDGVDQIGEEITDLSLAEGLELAMAVVPVVVSELGSL